MAMGKCRECGRQVSKSAGVCPGCGVKNPAKGTSWIAWAALALVLFVALRACSRLSDHTQTTVAAPTPAAVAAPVASVEKPPLLAAATLLQAYRANEVKADLKYKGKRFRVTGTVAGIHSDIADDPQVLLVTDLLGVSASGLRKEFVASLNKGDPIEAECTVEGEVLGSPMLDCSRQ